MLYGSVQLSDVRRRTDATRFVHKLGGPVAPRIGGVRFGKRAWHYTTPSRSL